MPKVPIDYSKTVMYKLMCKDPSVKDIYISQTTNPVLRKSQHKMASVHQNTKLYKCIRDNGGWNNWQLIVLENFPCNSSHEADKKVSDLIMELNAQLNCCPCCNR